MNPFACYSILFFHRGACWRAATPLARSCVYDHELARLRSRFNGVRLVRRSWL